MANSFEVHLKSLLDFAWELEGQLEALRVIRERLSGLGENAAPLGGFAEADSLSNRHALAAQEMSAVLDTVQQAVAFAAGVTRAVAAGYQEHDEQAAAVLRGTGTVYYSSSAGENPRWPLNT